MTDMTRFIMYIHGIKLTVWNGTQKQLTLLSYCLKGPCYIINFDPMHEKTKKENKACSKCTVLLISPVSQVRWPEYTI